MKRFLIGFALVFGACGGAVTEADVEDADSQALSTGTCSDFHSGDPEVESGRTCSYGGRLAEREGGNFSRRIRFELPSVKLRTSGLRFSSDVPFYASYNGSPTSKTYSWKGQW